GCLPAVAGRSVGLRGFVSNGPLTPGSNFTRRRIEERHRETGGALRFRRQRTAPAMIATGIATYSNAASIKVLAGLACDCPMHEPDHHDPHSKQQRPKQHRPTG